MRRGLLAAGAAVVLFGGGIAVAATQHLSLGGGDTASISCAGQSLSVSQPDARNANVLCVPLHSRREALYTTRAAAGREDPDTNWVTLGVRFTVARDGYVSGVRFYRAAHSRARTVDLWQGGKKLTEGTAPANGTGWVDATFATPVPVSQGTTYAASYFTSRYVVTSHGFNAARTVQDITAPVGAGVYHYGTSPAAPSKKYANSEYYASPLFTPGRTPTPTPTPTPTTAPAPGSYSCSVPLGNICGAYGGTPMSNGFNSYVSNQSVNPQIGITETVNANSLSDWNVVADTPTCGGCVQTFPNANQLTQDWHGSGWGGSGSQATPLASLASLKVNYDETSPAGGRGTEYEFAPDVWDDNYAGQLGPGSGDVMFWADTSLGRCTNTGLSSGDILGQASFDGQDWTVYRYGPIGGEIIFILDGESDTDPAANGTCAQQASGSIDIKAGFDWLTSNGFITGAVELSQLNAGWEITEANNATFTMNSYSITAS